MDSLTKIKSTKPLVLYFHVHQPLRLKKVGFLDIGDDVHYFDDSVNSGIIRRTMRRCYLPLNEMLGQLTRDLPNVRLTFSLSGPALRQFEKFEPAALESFQSLVATGCVELLGETSHHSLASVLPSDEFPEQVREHTSHLQRLFGVKPTVFRNTELIYSNSIGSRVAKMGFKGMITDGVERTLEGRKYLGVYRHPFHNNFKILLRHNALSDDIGFRFVTGERTLNVKEYFRRIEDSPGVTMLGFDYETFGEHMAEDTGITKFLRDLIIKVSESDTVQLMTPSDVFKKNGIKEKLDIPDFISWADSGKDLSAWLENEIQNEAFLMMQSVEDQVRKSANSELLETWRNLQTSDHFYYMSTKTAADGDVHSYFSPYNSPYEAYINYMNIINDFKLKLQRARAHDPMQALEFERRHEPVPHWAEKAQAQYHEMTSR